MRIRVPHGLHHWMIWLAPIAAAVFFGSWAAIVNSAYGPAVMSRAGIGQGLYAFAATWLVTRAACSFYRRAGGWIRGWLAGFGMSLVVMLFVPLAIHGILGTPEVVAAILPGLVWGCGYVSILLTSLARATRRADT